MHPRAWWPPSPLRDIPRPIAGTPRRWERQREKPAPGWLLGALFPAQAPPGWVPGVGQDLEGGCSHPPALPRGKRDPSPPPRGSSWADKAQPQPGKSLALLGEAIPPALVGAQPQREATGDMPAADSGAGVGQWGWHWTAGLALDSGVGAGRRGWRSLRRAQQVISVPLRAVSRNAGSTAPGEAGAGSANDRRRWEMAVASWRGCTRGLVPVPSHRPRCRRAYSCWRRMSTASARLFTYASGFTWGWFSSEGLQGRQKGMAEHGRAPNQVPCPRPSCCCARSPGQR